MVQGRGRLRLGDEPPDALFTAHETRWKDLQRHPAVERLVSREVDLAHPSRRERPHDAVAGDLIFGLERSSRGHGQAGAFPSRYDVQCTWSSTGRPVPTKRLAPKRLWLSGRDG